MDANAVFYAEDAKDISEQFKTISMSISTMAQKPSTDNEKKNEQTSINVNKSDTASKVFPKSDTEIQYDDDDLL